MRMGDAFNRPTLAAAAVLLIGLVTLHAAAWAAGWHLRKAALPPPQPLYQMEKTLGTYHQTGDRTLPSNVVHELGTERYLLRTYQDVSASPGEPAPAVKMHLAYYTGLPDAAPHVQERLYLLGGAPVGRTQRRTVKLRGTDLAVRDDGTVTASLPGGERVTLPSAELPVRITRHTPRGGSGGPGGRPAQTVCIGYTYLANGRFLAAPQRVQRAVADKRRPAAYWCKIELMPGHMTDGRFRGIGPVDEAAQAMGRFLSDALPRIMRYMPAPPGGAGSPDHARELSSP